MDRITELKNLIKLLIAKYGEADMELVQELEALEG